MKLKTIEKQHGRIYQQVEILSAGLKKSRLDKGKLSCLEEPNRNLADFLGCTDTEAILFTVILALNFHYSFVTIENIAAYLGCEPLTVVKYIPEMDKLIKKRLIRADSKGNRRKSVLYDITYYITRDVLDAMFLGDISQIRTSVKTDLAGIMTEIKGLVEERNNGKLTFDEMLEDVRDTLRNNDQIPFTQRFYNLGLDVDEALILLYLCVEAFHGMETLDLNWACARVLENIKVSFAMKRGLISGTYDLVKKDLVKLQDGAFRSDREIMLTEKAFEILFGGEPELAMSVPGRRKDFIDTADITTAHLFFNRGDAEKLAFLTRTLRERNYRRMCKGLEGKGMRSGITCLFHGPPGTGKTASVFKLARDTGRDILPVDIASTRSMWFGESEKNIREIFRSYRKQLSNSRKVPILLFNEADGVLGIRTRDFTRSVSQTQNAMQNILLQELEDFKGILVATTNLVGNLDSAFERRFLYKILFSTPDPATRARIWRDRLPALELKQARQLAAEFDFSGAQIDNIARKIITEELFTGSMPSMERIREISREESLEGNLVHRTIGYKLEGR
jgi:hypothetical protein